MILARKKNRTKPFGTMTRAIKLLRKEIDAVCDHDPVQNAQRGKAAIRSLRDTFGSRMAQNNMSLRRVSKLLGHMTPIMTRKYAHLLREDVADEAGAILNR